MVLNILGEKFGYTTNAKGYKVLPPYIGVIQGDHIYDNTIDGILFAVTAHGWSAENMVFGCGGGLRRVERNDVDFAMKCSEVVIGNTAHKVSKLPVTDSGKASKAGRLALIRQPEGYRTVQQSDLGKDHDLLREVFRNGEITSYADFTAIRARAAESTSVRALVTG